ncbi:centrosomal protein of 68 kDa-like isoform X2 [Xyrauchen texanus]|uniref:centrosomal protein of 68 kDa-like isoform X2 n=1 Tax=Xyrauchen texanus TaxID=154827 RepID=UPI0022421AC6|nr:centrosomal protein of 68 kDa-like isoform X2 [Xyrauchen texanus]
MALGVDKTFSGRSLQMENKNYGRWKTRIPELIRSDHSRPLSHRASQVSRPAHGQEAKDSEKEQSGCKKTVTMAPLSRYMRDKSLYTMRKPLISSQKQMPILKNPSMHVDSKKEAQMSYIADSPKEMEKSLPKQSVRGITDVSLSYTFSPPMSREDLNTSMSVSDLRLWSRDEEPIFNTSTNKCSLSSPPLASMSLSAPPVPKWISTPQNTLSNHTSHFNSKVNTRADEIEIGRDSLLNTSSSQYFSKNHPLGLKHMSPYQASYWACAIPNTMPPTADRKSSNWDPEKEYQALLDYTYPLRPNMANTWCSPESESLLRTDPLLQDSGIELDCFCSSSTLSFLDLSQIETRQGKYSPATGKRSTEFGGLNLKKRSHYKSSDGILSSSLFSSLDQAGLSVKSLDCERKPGVHYRKFGIFSTFRSVPTFISSTHILPCCDSQGELDEEFLRLPEQLQELQVLSQQLRDISVKMGKPLESEITSVRSPTVVGKQEQVVEQRGKENVEVERGSVLEVPLQSEDHLEEAKEPGARMQMISQEVNRSSLREVEAIMDQLSGMSMSELQRMIPTDQDEEETKESLIQHIQAFCTNLEKLVQWLYKVVDKVEVLSPPMVDLASVKASLADYKTFQEEVQAYKPLTADILQTGEMLLHCMNSASPSMDCLTGPRTQEASEGIS